MTLAGIWEKSQAAQGKQLEIVYDTDLEALPDDRPYWIFGFENIYYDRVVIGRRYEDMLSEKELDQIGELSEENTLVYALPGQSYPGQNVGFVGTRHQEALTGLARKLFHYGSYGYLGFEGTAPDNVLKGVFPVLDSSLDHVMPYGDTPAISQKLPVREPLAGM
jgi:hypothetical protein